MDGVGRVGEARDVLARVLSGARVSLAIGFLSALLAVAFGSAIAAGLPLILTTLGFTFLGEALRDALDPRLQMRTLT